MSDRRQSEHDGDRDRIETGPVAMSLETRMAIHEIRLQNGQKAFDQLRDKMTSVEVKMAPKPVNYVGITSIGIGLLLAAVTALWGLSVLFSDRPTRDEVERQVQEQRKAIDEQSGELRTMSDRQTEQRVILDTVRSDVQDTSRKLDILISNDRAAAATARPGGR